MVVALGEPTPGLESRWNLLSHSTVCQNYRVAFLKDSSTSTSDARATRAHSLDLLLQSSPGEEHMDIIAQLKAERDKAAQQVNALDTAIRALSGLNTRGSYGPRRISAAARARISASQKARWARARGQKVVSIAPKRHISAAGLARIRAAQRARWARIKKRARS
jgi:hypothetical protein